MTITISILPLIPLHPPHCQKQLPKWALKYELTDLPRLPIPPLADTIAQYLETVRRAETLE